jgi:hypothetical protein
MGLFDNQIAFIDSLAPKIQGVFRDVLKEYDYVIVDYIAQDQLFEKGEDGLGQKLIEKNGYARLTISIKKLKGQPTDRVTLKDTGDFYESIRINVYDDRFEVSQNVPYGSDLIKKYGGEILLPSDVNMNDFIKNYFIPEFKKIVNDKFAE